LSFKDFPGYFDQDDKFATTVILLKKQTKHFKKKNQVFCKQAHQKTNRKKKTKEVLSEALLPKTTTTQ
jgi:hypothetical protein